MDLRPGPGPGDDQLCPLGSSQPRDEASGSAFPASLADQVEYHRRDILHWVGVDISENLGAGALGSDGSAVWGADLVDCQIE